MIFDHLKKTILVLVCTCLVLGTCVAAAQNSAAAKRQHAAKTTKTPDRITPLELKHFDEFLDKHSDIRHDLAKNPKLVDDPNYLVNHPDLDSFLREHQGVKGELLKHPQEFMAREKQYEGAESKSADRITPLELKHFDEFLDKNPGYRHDLVKDPKLIDSPSYLANRPALDAFLKEHQGVKGELLKHPQEFMQREEQYEKNEKH